jgi:hypothetical protein
MIRRFTPQTKIVPRLAGLTIIAEAKRSAWKPYRELANRGVPPRLIELFMFKLMIRQWTRKRTDWDEPKSMKRYTLKRFPARIQQMAQDIRALNADQIVGPLHVLLSGEKQRQTGRNLAEEMRDRSTRDRKQLAYRLHELPAVMTEYAIYLSSISDVVGQVRRHPYNPMHHCLVAFVEVVHRITHCFMYEEIAALATAIISMTGVELDIASENLRKLYRNNPHLRSDVFPE